MEDKNTELNDTDKKLHISEVRNSILELLGNHKYELRRLREVYPEITDDVIGMKTTHCGQRGIENEILIINEIEKILKYCF